MNSIWNHFYTLNDYVKFVVEGLLAFPVPQGAVASYVTALAITQRPH